MLRKIVSASALSLVFAATAANAAPLARLRFGLANPAGAFADPLTVSVEVGDDQQVKVHLTDRDGGIDQYASAGLGAAAFAAIRGSVRQLANAPVSTTHHVINCMIARTAPDAVLTVARNYDAVTDTFKADLQTVLTEAGCWIGTQTSPDSLGDKEAAADLRGGLRMLGLGLTADIL